MKILFLEQFSELGGGQQCLIDLLPGIRERGWEATVAAPGSGPLFDAAREAGAETAVIQLGPYANGRKTPGDSVRFMRDTLRLRNWIARQDADLIYSSAPRPLVAAALGARGRPVVFHAQHHFGKWYASALASMAAEYARSTVIADAEYVARQFRPYVGPGRLHIVYNGVAEIPFATWKFWRDHKWRIGIIGRIAPMKGHTDLLRAAALLALQGFNANYVICGAPMFAPAGYMAEVQRLALNLPVDFLGWRRDIPSVLANLDLLVVPSTSAEATTRVILEAFSAGIPVIAYAIGGIPEIIRDSENGFLVPECEPRALARKIQEVTRLDFGPIAARARADWERHYSVARYREEMIRVIAGCGDACATTT
ncbi:MAG: glycosyltransferase family 4 protein [Bryobacteraceae bacterium]